MPEKEDNNNAAENSSAGDGNTTDALKSYGSVGNHDTTTNGGSEQSSQDGSTENLHASALKQDLTETKPNKAKPKHINGRGESSRKFRIQSVNKEDDPLYNKDDSAPGTPDVNEDHREKAATFRLGSVTESEGVSSPDREIRFGEPVYIEPESDDDTSSTVSTIGQLPDFSATRSPHANGGHDFTKHSDYQVFPSSTSIDSKPEAEVEVKQPGKSPKTVKLVQGYKHKPEDNGTAGRPHKFTKRPGDHKLKCDDSFFKQAVVTERLNSKNEIDPESYTEIEFPVPNPGTASHESTIHETVASNYETNLSINTLLRERHKGSLAAMGRLFGSKQREINQQKSLASLVPVVKPPEEKKKPCKGIKPIHVCLVIAAALIISASVTTLVLYQTTIKLEAANIGYYFNHRKQTLVIYPWKIPDHQISKSNEPVFKANMGVNIKSGAPNNCSKGLYDDGIRTDIGCYKWQSAFVLNMSASRLDNQTLCIDVEWKTKLFDPKLEDCFEIGGQFGRWYGGFTGNKSFPLGERTLDSTSYLPGKVFGDIVERFWISTNGVAVVASHHFPLQFRVAQGRICLSSWYGYKSGNRTMSYSICRSNSHANVHKHVMQRHYAGQTENKLNVSKFAYPIYTSHSEFHPSVIAQKVKNEFSYILNSDSNLLALNQENATSTEIPYDRQGIQISPVVPLSSSVTPDYLASDLWIKSSDSHHVTRIFNVNGNLSLLVNTSSESLSEFLGERIPDNDMLVKISESGVAHITSQDYYSIGEIDKTFQHYNQKLWMRVENQTNGLILTSVLAGLDRTSVIVSLPPITNLRETVQSIIQTSLMGYNIINPGEITGDLSPDLFIRAVQLSVFMPVIEFSESIFTHYSKDKLALKDYWLRVRDEYSIAKIIEEKMADDPHSPLYTPVWWHEPDSDNFRIVDEFIFDNSYLIAPILDEGATSRTVYFPAGIWLRIQPRGQKLGIEPNIYRGLTTERISGVSLNETLIFEHVKPIGGL